MAKPLLPEIEHRLGFHGEEVPSESIGSRILWWVLMAYKRLQVKAMIHKIAWETGRKPAEVRLILKRSIEWPE